MNNEESIEFVKGCVSELFSFIVGISNLNTEKIESIFGKGEAGIDRFFNAVIITSLNIKVSHTISRIKEESVSDYIRLIKGSLDFLKDGNLTKFEKSNREENEE